MSCFKIAAFGQQRPHDPRIFVSQCHGRHIAIASGQQAFQPIFGLLNTALCMRDNRSCTVD